MDNQQGQAANPDAGMTDREGAQGATQDASSDGEETAPRVVRIIEYGNGDGNVYFRRCQNCRTVRTRHMQHLSFTRSCVQRRQLIFPLQIGLGSMGHGIDNRIVR